MAGSRAVSAANRLRVALEGAADALAHGNVDGLLASEGGLEFALAEMPPMVGLDAEERAAVRAELEGVERALLRCRRLGGNLTDYVRLTLASQAEGRGSADYTPGKRHEDGFSGRGLNARV